MRRRDLMNLTFTTAASSLVGTKASSTLTPQEHTRKHTQQTPLHRSTKIWRGVNIAGAEFGSASAEDPGRLGQDYFYPTTEYLNYLSRRGCRLARLPVKWERLQVGLGSTLNPHAVSDLKQSLDSMSRAGISVIIDLHNFGRYRESADNEQALGDGISEADFAEFWGRLSTALRRQDNIYGWGLMNEPHDLDSKSEIRGLAKKTIWKRYSAAAVDEIRSRRSRHRILVAGDSFSGAQRWREVNGEPWINERDNKIVYEAHYYFDVDHTGFYAENWRGLEHAAASSGFESVSGWSIRGLRNYIKWLRQYNVAGFVGELGWPSTKSFNAVGTKIYRYLDQNHCSSTQWAAGEYWDSSYKLSIYNRRKPATALNRYFSSELHS